ncbi:hypothetical protein [Crenothrix sp.]|uniref:hypothetical protein n=1 Tax=Crenothrix sp. TaxID=3100433 RepID=UPI00374D0068
MTSLTKIFTVAALVLTTATASASIPLGGVRKSTDGKYDLYGCMQTNDYYVANFAAFQTQPGKPVDPKKMPPPECVTLPALGTTLISVDLLDRDVRRKEVSMKVTGDKGAVLLETPPTMAKQGVITGTVDFKTKGNYTVVLTVNDTDLHTPSEISALRIPITVAMDVVEPASKTAMISFFGFMGALVVMLAVLVPRFVKPNTAA